MEILHAAVRRDCRQRPRETETVRKHYVASSSHSELVAEESLSIQEIPYQRLSRPDVYVIGIDRASSHMPFAVLYIFLQTVITIRIIFLCPHVFYGSLKIELEIGRRLVLKPIESLLQRILYILAYRLLNGPVPLRVKM